MHINLALQLCIIKDQIMKIILLNCILFICIMQAKAQYPIKDDQTTPIVLGQTYKLKSAILAEQRTINVYLPADFQSSDTARYPVIYLLDGGVDEDFIHVAGLVQFSSQPWLHRLPPSIIIGIANTNRERDMTFPTTVSADRTTISSSGGSAKFISFIEKELQPWVKQRYKTSNERVLIGESLAGLLATEILFKAPHLFNKYIIISPSLWWDNGSLLVGDLRQRNNYKALKLEVYIGVGKEGLAPSEQPHVMEVDANLLKEKLDNLNNASILTHFDYMPAENHATVAHQALLNAFRLLHPDKL